MSSRAGRVARRWTASEDLIIRQLYSMRTTKELLILLPDRTAHAVVQRALTFGIQKTKEHRREQSRKSFSELCERRGVKPGQQPRPIGATHRKGRYILVKVAQPDVWKPLHTHIWEQANGAVPEGMIVAAKDGDVKNTDLANLCLRTFAENQLRRNKHYKDLPEEIVDILHLQNEIKKEIKRKTSDEK